jgi:hypothetical protein
MKKSYILIPVAVVALGLVGFQSKESVTINNYIETHSFSGGGQAAFTGAPGEQNCTACHVGGTLDGSTENVLTVLDGFTPVTSYVAGNSYTVSVQMNSDPAKKGFSATCLDGTLTMAGTFTGDGALGGTQDFTSGGRHYVSHMATSNTNTQTFWAWTWDAPATDVGDVTFYVATNAANNNNANSGDMIYLSTHTINGTASVDETEMLDFAFEAGYSISNNTVVVDFNSVVSEEMFFNLVDLNGRSVYTKNLGSAIIGSNQEEIQLPETLENGIYVVNFFVGNSAMSQNIMVQK